MDRAGQRLFFQWFSKLAAIVFVLGFIPEWSFAGMLHVYRGDMKSAIKVAPNTVLQLEMTEPFNELSVADPSIADIGTLSDTRIELRAQREGSTTLTILHGNWLETSPSHLEIIVKSGASEYQTGDTVKRVPDFVYETVEFQDQRGVQDIEIKPSSGIIVQTEFAFEEVYADNEDAIGIAVMSAHFVYIVGRSVGSSKLIFGSKKSGEVIEFAVKVSPQSANNP